MNKSIQKALDIMELFWRGHKEMSILEMAELTNLDKATVYRIVSTLAQRGYLHQKTRKGKYSLGTAFLEFSGILKNRSEIRDIIIPYLTDLTQSVRESAVIAIWDGREGVTVETFHVATQIDSPLKVIQEEGISLPLHCTGPGKIFLAHMAEEELARYYAARTLDPLTSKTIVDLEVLKQQLAAIRKDNIAYDREEYALGVSAVASGVKDSRGKVICSLCIIAPSVRMGTDKMEKLAQTVKRCCQKISQEVRYLGDFSA